MLAVGLYASRPRARISRSTVHRATVMPCLRR